MVVEEPDKLFSGGFQKLQTYKHVHHKSQFSPLMASTAFFSAAHPELIGGSCGGRG